jgi:hypothetical protein
LEHRVEALEKRLNALESIPAIATALKAAGIGQPTSEANVSSINGIATDKYELQDISELRQLKHKVLKELRIYADTKDASLYDIRVILSFT